MALKIQGILDKAAAQGMVLRENLPAKVRSQKGLTPEEKHQFDISIPKYVGDADMSPHVTYLRELVGIQNALRGPKFGPKSSERARVVQFLTEHDLGEKGLALLSTRRKEEGAAAKAKRGQVTEQTQEGVAKAAVVTKQSEGAASEVRDRTEELRAQYETPGKKTEVSTEKITETSAKVEPSALAEVVTAPAHEAITEGKGKAKAKEIKAKKEPKPKPVAKTQQEAKPAEAAAPVTSEVTPAPKPAEKKGTIDIEMRRQLGHMGYSHGDIQKMTEARANHILDEGIVKGAEEVVAEEAVPEGLTAAQAKAFKKLTPEQRASVIAALEARSADVSDKQASKRKGSLSDYEYLDTLSDAELIARMDEELGALGNVPAEVRDMDVEEMLRHLNKPKEVQLRADEYDIWETSVHKARDIFGHEDSALSEPMKTTDILKDLDLSYLDKFPKYIQDFARKRLVEVLDRVPMYLASNELMADVMGVAHNKTPGGYFTRDSRGGPGHIVINRITLEFPGEFERTVIHEALHAALAHRIDTSKDFRTKIKILMTVLDRDTQNHPGREFVNYSLTNEHEFVSEALSNQRLQAIMANMELEPEVAQALALGNMRTNTLWGAFVEKVRKALGLPPGTHNLLHESLKVVAPYLGAEYGKAVRLGYVQDVRTAGTKHASSMDRLANATAAMKRGLARIGNDMSPEAKRTRRDLGYIESLLSDARDAQETGHADVVAERLEIAEAKLDQLQPSKHAAMLDIDRLRDAAVGKATDTGVNVKGRLALAKDKISTLWDMSGRGEHSSLFGASNPLNRLFDLRAKMEAFKDTVLEEVRRLESLTGYSARRAQVSGANAAHQGYCLQGFAARRQPRWLQRASWQR